MRMDFPSGIGQLLSGIGQLLSGIGQLLSGIGQLLSGIGQLFIGRLVRNRLIRFGIGPAAIEPPETVRRVACALHPAVPRIT
jgi:X-X-X-Leu-X-X-Gly heptad repeat protein